MIIEKIWRQLVIRRLEDSNAITELASQAGKVLHLKGGKTTLALRINEQGVPVPVHPGITPAAVLTFDLASIMRGKQSAPHAEGDSDLLAAVGAIRGKLDLSAMELFEEACGEKAASAATVTSSWARTCRGDTRRRLGRNLRNWLENESDMFATQSQLAELARDTEQLATRTTKLNERAEELTVNVRL